MMLRPLLLALALLAPTAAQAACDSHWPAQAEPEAWLACSADIATQALVDLEILAADDMEGRRPGTEGSLRARAYIVERFEAAGAVPVYAGGFERGVVWEDDDEKVAGANIVAKVEGTGGSDNLIVVTAHYDHFGIRRGDIYNGADDNASGVAAMLAIAADLAASPPRHTVIFAAVDGEETGYYGSFALVRDDDFPIGDVALNINLDMLSKSRRNEIFAMGGAYNSSIRALIAALHPVSPVTLMERHDRRDDPEYEDWTADSDQYAFHRRGIPWLYFGVEEHAEYHEPTDDFATVEPDFFRATLAVALAAVRLADERLDTIRPADETPDDD